MDFILNTDVNKTQGWGVGGLGEWERSYIKHKIFNGQTSQTILQKSPDLKENSLQRYHACPHKETQQALPKGQNKMLSSNYHK